MGEKIFMPTMYFPEVPPCTQVLLTECKRKSQLLPHQPSKLRLLLHQKENTLYGLVDLFLLHFLLSRLCGFPNKNMMNPAQELFTENVFKCYFFILFCFLIVYRISCSLYFTF